MNFRAIALALVALSALCCAGCGKTDAQKPASKPLVKTVSSGPVEITITAEPQAVRLDGDIFLSIKTKAPGFIDVNIPPVADRLTGFSLQGSFDKEPVSQENFITRERRFRITPIIADEYRIGPMAITAVDNSVNPPSKTWFATPPLVFTITPLSQDGSDLEMRDIIGPTKMLPGIRTLALWILWVAAAAGMITAIWAAYSKITKIIKLRRMSPRERALHELAELIARDLIVKKRIKDFYVELTMIVRRYIERAHKIRAPEQTTEEFLIAATSYPGFKKEVVHKLKDFLQSADLVKFAAFHPDKDDVDKALGTARDYIRTDEESHDV